MNDALAIIEKRYCPGCCTHRALSDFTINGRDGISINCKECCQRNRHAKKQELFQAATVQAMRDLLAESSNDFSTKTRRRSIVQKMGGLEHCDELIANSTLQDLQSESARARESGRKFAWNLLTADDEKDLVSRLTALPDDELHGIAFALVAHAVASDTNRERAIAALNEVAQSLGCRITQDESIVEGTATASPQEAIA